MKVQLKPNAKDIYGYTLPLCFFDGYVRVVKEKETTCILKCSKHKIEVSKEYIRKP